MSIARFILSRSLGMGDRTALEPGMCNDYGNHIPYSDYLAAFSQTRIPVRWPTAAPNLEPREDIWPTDKAPVIRRTLNREYDQAHQAMLAVSSLGGRIPGRTRGVDAAARIDPFSSRFNWASLRQSGSKAVAQKQSKILPP